MADKGLKIADYTKGKVIDTDMGDYNKRGMQLYGANVQYARAIPSIVDGFKPVQRRCLYAAAKIAHADKKSKKVIAINGSIILIHPHGDISVEQSLVSLAKPWEVPYPLLDIEGNIGTPAGDPAAAGRYLDAQISKYAYDCYFKDWDDKVVEMVPTYNPDYEEPLYLVSKFPDLLLRPSIGFTFGMSTNIPSYNMTEAFNATIELIKNPDYEPVLVPDMPTGCIIMDEGNFPDICATGSGTFRMRANIEINEDNNELIISSMPYKVNISDIKQKIVNLKDMVFPSLVNIFDDSDREQVKLELKFLPGTDLEVMKSLLYKKTSLQSFFYTQMTYVNIDEGIIKTYSLKEIIQYWIATRRIVKRKTMNIRRSLYEQRYHALKILIAICTDKKLLREVIQLIKESNSEVLVKKLHDTFPDISTAQAYGICNMRISELSKDSLKKYKKEFPEVKDEIKDLDKKIKNPKEIDKIIINELKEAIKKYAKPRRCKVEVFNKNKDKLVSDKDYLLIFTEDGYVKKMNSGSKSIGELNDGDNPITALKANNRDKIIIFDSLGMVHALEVKDVNISTARSKGYLLSRYININGKIISVIPEKNLHDDDYFIFVTKKGMIKKTAKTEFSLKGSLCGIKLNKGDELVYVIATDKDDDIIIYTEKGFGLRFITNSFEPTGRVTKGVIGIKLADDDNVIGATKVLPSDTDLMILTANGKAKICTLNSFEPMKRMGESLILTKLKPADNILKIYTCNSKNHFKLITMNEVIDVSYDDIPQLTRNHAPKKIIKLKKSNQLIRCIKL